MASRYVFDSSSVLAIVLDEVGADFAVTRLADGCISSVNQTEIVTRLLDLGWSIPDAFAINDMLGLEVIPFDEDEALSAAALRTSTRSKGLSLGDRACIATAQIIGGTAVTADKAWAEIKLPCPVEVIR